MPKGKKKQAEKTLTQEMKALLAKVFMPDLEARAKQPAVEQALRERWQAEREAKRTADEFKDWVEHTVEQVGAAWILSCLFVRVLEDRGYLERRRLAGEGAMDSFQQFSEIAPSLTDRDYVLTVFRELMAFPGGAEVLGPAHNPAWRLSPSNDSVRALLALLREEDAEGKLRFHLEGNDTRFLGDLYQDLSEGVRKRYALLQTPDFVESFILDQTLEPAIKEFGLEKVRLIDPTCGSGHFLLGAFQRLFEHRQRAKPALDPREHATAALGQVYGVDINPYAVAIARFRLTLQYLELAGIDKLARAPRVDTNLVVADSLLHGAKNIQHRLSDHGIDKNPWGGADLYFALDDERGARSIFGQSYHAVVGNPPYITCKDAVLREVYRRMYESAAGKFALGVPFTELFFQISVDTGFIGLINANSFMKREFGKSFIEKVLPRLELTGVVDTSGAYIPGHGTPTVLLFGRNRPPIGDRVLTLMGKRGEPTIPDDAAKGFVWSTIAQHYRNVGFENDFLSIAEIPRMTFCKHPWSIGGGGAAALKEFLEEETDKRLNEFTSAIGVMALAGNDEIYITESPETFYRLGIDPTAVRPLGVGESFRDWSAKYQAIIYPHSDDGSFQLLPSAERHLWTYRSILRNYIFYGKTKEQRGLDWRELGAVLKDKLHTPLSIAFAFVATHNHFVLDRGSKVFNRSAPIIKLPGSATEDDHLALLAYLNSSTACFWMKQVFYPKGTAAGDISKEKMKPEDNRYEFTGTGLEAMPMPSLPVELVILSRELEELAKRKIALEPVNAIPAMIANVEDLAADLRRMEGIQMRTLMRMVAIQEDLDWAVYKLFRLADGPATKRWSNAVHLAAEERPFATDVLPASLASEDAHIWQARKEAIAESHELRLVESLVFKRRWLGARGVFGSKVATYTERAENAALEMIAEHAEKILSKHNRPLSLRELAHSLPSDTSKLTRLVGEDDPIVALHRAVSDASVPFLASCIFTEKGLKKRTEWEATWEAQRAEDRGEWTTEIPIPPKYGTDDYLEFSYWSNRGKLDVPKERFISYPGCERDEDKTPVVGWAGWNHLQRAEALATLFQEREQDDWGRERLTPILAGLLELIPWLKQWHNEPDPKLDGQRMGNEYEKFVSEKSRKIGLTLEDLRNWRQARNTKSHKSKSAKKAEPAHENESEET